MLLLLIADISSEAAASGRGEAEGIRECPRRLLELLGARPTRKWSNGALSDSCEALSPEDRWGGFTKPEEGSVPILLVE